jgi:hypothetical protein
LASGLVLLTGATHLARLYDGRAATRQQGIFGGMLTAGGTIALLGVPEVVVITGWVGLHTIGALIAGAAILFTLHGRRNEYAWELASEHVERRSVRELLCRPPMPEPGIWLAGVCYVAIIWGYISLPTFISSFFTDLGITENLDAVVLFITTLALSVEVLLRKRSVRLMKESSLPR